MSNALLYPTIQGKPGSAGTVRTEPAQAPEPKEAGALESGSQAAGMEFNQILGQEVSRPVVEPLKFSAHASARMQSRKLQMSPEKMRELNQAIDKAAAKGLDDTLVLTKDAAFIVSVKNRTVVTAMDRNGLEGNVFTNIDGAVLV